MSKTAGRKLLPTSAVARRYDKTSRTIFRWTESAEKTGFPKPITLIHQFKFWDEDALDRWDEEQRKRGYVKAVPTGLARRGA